jgi:hypothetical protein
MEELLKLNEEAWEHEVDEEIERRNKYLHALNTLIICNKFVTGKRKYKYLKNKEEPIIL